MSIVCMPDSGTPELRRTEQDWGKRDRNHSSKKWAFTPRMYVGSELSESKKTRYGNF